jgi:predicted porin
MNKLLLAVAVLGTGAAAAASAQSNVSVYGLIDLGIVQESGAPAAKSVTKVSSGVSTGSRLGFRGSEELGGGVSAIFLLESGYQADTGTMGQGNLLFGRQIFVGLQGPLGTVKVGRQYTPIDGANTAVDPFTNGTTGRAANLLVRNYVGRFDNGITYASPVIGGVQAILAYGLGEVPGDAAARRFAGGSVAYRAGHFNVQLAYQGTNTAPDAARAPAVLPGADSNALLGGTYDFGVATAHLAYGKSKSDRGGVTTSDTDDYLVGVSIPFGAGKFLAHYIRRNDKSAAKANADYYAVGYTHSLTMRTMLYGTYGYIRNTNGAAYTVGSAIEVGSGNKALAIGIRHSF